MNRPQRPKGSTRRAFLGAVTATGLSSAAGGCLAPPKALARDATAAPGVFAAHLSDVSVGAVIHVFSDLFFLLRDSAGLYAFTSVCTHEQCPIFDAQDRIRCLCHGSEFDYNGEVLQGPALLPLEHYRVILDVQGDIYVDVTSVVDPDTRLEV